MKSLPTLLFLLLFFGTQGFAQTSIEEASTLSFVAKGGKLDQQSLFDKWQEEEILSLRLEADFTQITNDKKSTDYQTASLTLHPKTASALTTPVKVKARGKYRRRICDFPPLKLKLAEKEVAGIQVGNYKTFKLVTHCHNELLTKATVLREYLAYKLYAALSPESYRVQLVEILYIDSGKTLPKLKRYGFLLEDKDELEDRLQADNCDCAFSANTAASQLSAAQMALFQFMIGNNDWATVIPKNVKVFRSRQSAEQITIPYDFDFSAFVDAAYAFPNPDYAITDIRDRVLLIDGISVDALDQAVVLFQQKKEQLLDIIENQAGVSRSDKKQMVQYIQHFYSLLDQRFDWNHQMVVPFEAKEK